MSDELFARIETLEAQLHAATERLRVESSKGEEARARDAVVRKNFGLLADECVELAAGASDTHARRGVLYVTTSYVCFEVLPLLKLLADVRFKFLIKEIHSLDRVPGLFGRGSALAVSLRDGSVHQFTGLFNRRDIVQAILKSAEKFRPIEIHLLRNGRDHLEASRQAVAAASLGLEKLSPEYPPPPCARFCRMFLLTHRTQRSLRTCGAPSWRCSCSATRLAKCLATPSALRAACGRCA